MKTRSKIILTAVTLTLGASLFPSFANDSSKNFCELLNAENDTYTLIHYTPTLATTFFQGTDSSVTSLTIDSGTSQRFRVGGEYDLVNLLRVPTHGQLSQVRCQNRISENAAKDYKSGLSFSEQLLSIKAQRESLRAGIQILENGLSSLNLSETEFKQKVANGNATITDLTSLSDAVYQVKAQLLEKKLELDRLKSEENELQSILESDKSYSNRVPSGNEESARNYGGLFDEISLRRKESILDSISFSLLGGYQKLYDSSQVSVLGGAYFGGVLKVNLGSVIVPFVHAEREARNISSKFEMQKEREKKVRIQALQTRSVFLEERLQNVGRMLRISGFNETNLSSSPLAVKLYANQLIAKANFEANNQELRYLTGGNNREVSSAKEERFAHQTNLANFRYTEPALNPETAKIRFKFKGYMSETKALGSGEERFQLGLMLRQRDQCNLVYVMLRLGASSRVVVQEKYNPKQTTHEQCQNHGYSSIKGSLQVPISEIAKGSVHDFEAQITKEAISVKFDGKEVWKGALPKWIQEGSNIGFRSDNVEVEFNLSEN